MYIGVAYVSSLGMGTVVTSHAWNNFPVTDLHLTYIKGEACI